MRDYNKDFQTVLDKFQHLNILVIGDLMLDKYIKGNVSRISPEAPVPVVKVELHEHRIGGAGNVAANLAALHCNVTVAGICGKDTNGKIIENIFNDLKINPHIQYSGSRPTTVKTRILAKHQQIVRVDEEDSSDYDADSQLQLLDKITGKEACFDGIILSDYKKGLLTADFIQNIEKAFPKTPIIVDPKGHDYTKYSSATVIKPNWNEFKTAINQPDLQLPDIESHAQELVKTLKLAGLIVTLGENGVFVLDNDNKSKVLPTVARDVFDVSGAGDTFIAAFTAGLLASDNWQLASALANIASGIAVGKLGTAIVHHQEIIDNLFLYE